VPNPPKTALVRLPPPGDPDRLAQQKSIRRTLGLYQNQNQNLSKKEKHEPKLLERRPSRWSGASIENQAEDEQHLLKLTTKGYNSLMAWL
jgi:hypothetical protein